MRVLNPVLTASMALFLSACVSGPKPLYDWGGYEKSLYKYYKKPTRAAKHTAVLQDIIDLEASGKKVPPGMRAELGFMLLEAGDATSAVKHFEKEKEDWPESSVLMERLIQRASMHQ